MYKWPNIGPVPFTISTIPVASIILVYIQYKNVAMLCVFASTSNPTLAKREGFVSQHDFTDAIKITKL